MWGIIGTNAGISKDDLVKDDGCLVLWETREVFQVLSMKCVMSVYLHTMWAWSGVSSLFYLVILLTYCRANMVPALVPMVWQK